MNADFLLNDPVLLQYQASDLIIDLSGDSLSDLHNIALIPLLGDFMAILLKKKIVVFSQSIGPFNKLTKPLARFCLNNANLITLREKESLRILNELGCDNPNVQIIPDIAFSLQPCSQQRISEILASEGLDPVGSRPFVGLGTSALLSNIHNNEGSYEEMMAVLADYIVEKLNAHLLLIPHVTQPGEYNDKAAALAIHRKAKNKAAISVLNGDYLPAETKGIIGKCELFIGARMHSNIASISMCVPTIAVGWSHKYRGIMESVGQEKYCCDYSTISLDDLTSKVNDIWIRREETKNTLCSEVPRLQKSILDGAMLLKKLLE